MLNSAIGAMHTAIFFFIIPYITILCCYRKFSARKGKRLQLTNWPIFGMFPGVLVNVGRVFDFITECLLRSDGTFLLKGPMFTNLDMLITSNPANIHHILIKNFSNFPKGPEFKKIFDVLGEGIFNAHSESWENQRRSVKSLINLTGFREFNATTSWNKAETGLFPILELGLETGTELDLQDLFKRFTFDCSCIVVLGHDPRSLCLELPDLAHEKAFAVAEEVILYRHLLPECSWKLLKWLRIGMEGKLIKAQEVVDQYLTYCISLKHQKFEAEDPTVKDDFDILTCYIRGLEGNREETRVSEETWRDTMLNLIVAGKDTISAALSWFFWLLATNPEEEKKIREEIFTNLSLNESGEWRYTNMEGLKNLVYLHGALCEALRLFPPVPFQHKAPMDDDVLPSGHRISPNTRTVLSFYSVGRMESVWGEDCLEFKPGRWISEPGRLRVEPSFKFVAFNGGPRSCLGKEMTFVQMKIVAAAVISRFRIQVVEGHPVLPTSSVILHMKHGLKVKVSKILRD